MQKSISVNQFPWLLTGFIFFFLCAFFGFNLGVTVSERPDLSASGALIKAYYSLSLFVVGGVDLGTPQGGLLIGRILVWLSYFGSPLLAAWGLIGTLLRALAPRSWLLKRLKNHIIIVGDGELATSYLRVLRENDHKTKVIFVTNDSESLVWQEYKHNFGAIVVSGDITHEFFLESLKVTKAQRILLLDNNSLRSYEAATILIHTHPELAPKIVIHSDSLRFMRSMENTEVANSCESFNTYQLAAAGLVQTHLLDQFNQTDGKDQMVIAGFGRFGQIILEELQRWAPDELEKVIIIDIDAHRRVLIADEQREYSGDYQREAYDGDISHPDVWNQVKDSINANGEGVVFVIGTGREEHNLRTATWLRRKYPEAMIISRTSKESRFAKEVGEEHRITNISISELFEEHLPNSWVPEN